MKEKTPLLYKINTIVVQNSVHIYSKNVDIIIKTLKVKTDKGYR